MWKATCTIWRHKSMCTFPLDKKTVWIATPYPSTYIYIAILRIVIVRIAILLVVIVRLVIVRVVIVRSVTILACDISYCARVEAPQWKQTNCSAWQGVGFRPILALMAYVPHSFMRVNLYLVTALLHPSFSLSILPFSITIRRMQCNRLAAVTTRCLSEMSAVAKETLMKSLKGKMVNLIAPRIVWQNT